MLIFPAIDIRNGRVVRLAQGDYQRMTVYSDDPEEIAKGFVRLGADCLHIVDLDGAQEGNPKNRRIIEGLCKFPLFTQVGGGMRSQAAVEETLALGVSRVVLGTIAVTDFPLVEKLVKMYGEKIAVGVDARDGLVATHGWQETTDLSSMDFCRKLLDAGVHTVVYTDIARDGELAGTNMAAYEELQKMEGLHVVASGGISFEMEIAKLRDMHLYGVILGKALYSGKLSLVRSIAIAKGELRPC